ncbi:DUF3047 domain-containing protein [Lacisediminimonas sp.]|uniref:DUF3047 domain-containing protein n=1 Tax=Lacisediminimonas sp. TaxID=3060582 RepID=UPI0027268325|nr:DUF3047 domain-containing protein [Lacisediminimonas sp.]MDO8300452.1 DUF3047 domain-containing protein [Lacisediminimonas sp.]
MKATRSTVIALLLSMAMAGTALRAAAQVAPVVPAVPAFSKMTPGAPVTGWLPLRPAPNAPDTLYTVTQDAGRTVLMAQARASMSGLSHALRVDIRRTPLLRWRWKIAAPLVAADMTKKAGDDYAARIYVMFDYPVEKLSFGTRAKLKLGAALYGQELPTAALNYVWDNRQPVGTIQANTYTDRARMIVVRSGAAQAGTWITETRDLAADFRAAFGEDAPDVVAVALATDTDNTGESALAWYGDIEFLPAPK